MWWVPHAQNYSYDGAFTPQDMEAVHGIVVELQHGETFARKRSALCQWPGWDAMRFAPWAGLLQINSESLTRPAGTLEIHWS